MESIQPQELEKPFGSEEMESQKEYGMNFDEKKKNREVDTFRIVVAWIHFNKDMNKRDLMTDDLKSDDTCKWLTEPVG
ncbi:unnamed protein product [Haemonchus placei]|uniref:Zinc finger, CCHC-type n=1 Tax=Haemonchus placei TaxID=6290 RepID=A0A0N4WVR5_HAEPC|nr:unnamed protein product [Haemonchus placei]